MTYGFECPCGKLIAVAPSSAGSEIVCDCGRKNTVPSLSKLRRMDSTAAVPTEAGVSSAVYYFDCSCGRRMSVDATQAGSDVFCACGILNSIPSLSKLDREKLFAPAPSTSRRTPVSYLIAEPATNLLTFAALSIMLSAVSFVADLRMLTTGSDVGLEWFTVRHATEGKLMLRMLWSLVMIASGAFIVYGCVQMRQLRNYKLCRAAAMMAMIPVLSPCCIVGIPFGWFAYAAIRDPEAQATFRD